MEFYEVLDQVADLLRSCEKTAFVPHRMSRSARNNASGGIVRPSFLAVFKLRTNSIFEYTSTGSSAEFAPLRILSTRRAVCLPLSYASVP
jgi:hypothetical protein